MRWCTSTRRREESSDNVWKSRLTAPYLWCCLAVRSRPSDPQQRRPDGRTACDGDVEHRAGCFLPNVDAAYWRYRRLVCREPPSMAEPCAADNGGQSRRVCSRLAAVYPTIIYPNKWVIQDSWWNGGTFLCQVWLSCSCAFLGIVWKKQTYIQTPLKPLWTRWLSACKRTW